MSVTITIIVDSRQQSVVNDLQYIRAFEPKFTDKIKTSISYKLNQT